MDGAPYPTCRQVSASGHLCGSPALRGKIFCYHHQRDRQRKENIRRGLGMKFQNGLADFDAEVLNSLDLPAPDDPVAAGVCLSNMFLALAAGIIPTKRAALMLYNLQIVTSNFATIAKYREKFEAKLNSTAKAVADPEPVASLTNPHREGDFLFSEERYEQSLVTDEPENVAADAAAAAAQAQTERYAAFDAKPEGPLPLTDIAPLEPEQVEQAMETMSDADWEKFCDQLWITSEQRAELKARVCSGESWNGDRAKRDAARRLLLKYNPRAVLAQLERAKKAQQMSAALDEFDTLPDDARAV
jgi:hypothetical protein